MNTELYIDRRDLTDQAYELLKARIVAREFQPNQKLSVDRLAKLLGVSRTPTKDALNRLAADGLITIEPRVGSFVTPITTKNIQDIFSLRLLFELYAAKEGFETITPGLLAEMQTLVVQMASCLDQGRYRPDQHAYFIELDHRLHRLIIDSAGNNRLIAMYEGLNVHLHIARAYYVNELENAEQGQREHEQIVQSYGQRDLSMLQRVLRSHITTTRDLVLQKLESVGGIL